VTRPGTRQWPYRTRLADAGRPSSFGVTSRPAPSASETERASERTKEASGSGLSEGIDRQSGTATRNARQGDQNRRELFGFRPRTGRRRAGG
jgi:hypothetical protein